MSALEEMRVAATAAARVGMPHTVTASFDTRGCAMMGVSQAAMTRTLGGRSGRPVSGLLHHGQGHDPGNPGSFLGDFRTPTGVRNSSRNRKGSFTGIDGKKPPEFSSL